MLQKLKRARLSAGYTQAQVGEMLGLTMAGCRQKETGDRKISIEEANKIAKILNLTLDDIFFEEVQSK